MILLVIRSPMEVRCRLEFDYADENEAEKVLRAVAVDNEGFVAARREGCSIVSEIASENILSLVQTLEDYLSCISVAEKAVKVAGERLRERAPPRPSRRQASRRGS